MSKKLDNLDIKNKSDPSITKPSNTNVALLKSKPIKLNSSALKKNKSNAPSNVKHSSVNGGKIHAGEPNSVHEGHLLT